MPPQTLFEQAVGLHQKGLLAEAEKLYARILATQPAALPPGGADAYATVLANRADVLTMLERPSEALADYDRALTLKPDFVEGLYNRGNLLREMKRPEDALASYDRALAVKPDFVEALFNRASLQWKLQRFEAAIGGYTKVLSINPGSPDALRYLGEVLCESGCVADGMVVFRNHAKTVYGNPASALRQDAAQPNLTHKHRHDREQREYLTGLEGTQKSSPAAFRMEEGGRLSVPAINPHNAADIAAQWQRNKPQIVVIDNFLTDEALQALRRYCWGSTMWRKVYQGGFLGAMPEHGLASPLMAQIADELRDTFPTVFGTHPLLKFWGFKYDSRLSGIDVHADFAAVNVNFWITPDEANLDPQSGGLVVWDVAAPPEWDFAAYNQKVPLIRQFLASAGARPTTIPHRANRAVIFDSDLFHETDKIVFRDGYLNRRINLTLLYGRR